jgi:hypothetical protein
LPKKSLPFRSALSASKFKTCRKAALFQILLIQHFWPCLLLIDSAFGFFRCTTFLIAKVLIRASGFPIGLRGFYLILRAVGLEQGTFTGAFVIRQKRARKLFGV